MTEYENHIRSIVRMTVMGFIALAGVFAGKTVGENEGKKYLAPTNAHLEYVNKDSLPDLVYKTGEIYLQTKDMKFVSYEDILKEEKAKLDSTYQAKADSLKKIYENKLEKGVK